MIIDSEISDEIGNEMEFSEVTEDFDAFKETQDLDIKNISHDLNEQKNVLDKPNFLQRLFKSKNPVKNIDEKNQNKESIIENKFIRSTFELRVDDEGNLVGLNVKKSPDELKGSKNKITQLFKIFTRKTKSEEAQEKSKIVDKISSLFSRIKLKKSGEGEESKVSNILGKIKGIFSKS